MSYYGGTITVDGRNLITTLMAGETIEFTRIWVGSGKMPDGVEPIDMKDLVAPVAPASSTIPTVDNGVLSMVVEYRNDMNGGLEKGFWLHEFGIYAKTENSEEILLYYATLGDSPQPVNAFRDNRIDIRRYPVTIALELDADIEVTYNPGSFITSSEAQQLIGAMVDQALEDANLATITDIVIPASGWVLQGSDEQSASELNAGYPYSVDVECADSTVDLYPSVALDKESVEIANAAQMSPTMESLDGIVRFWAKKMPTQDMTGTIALLPSGRKSDACNYVLPVATSTTLGGVKVQAGSGLTVDSEGNIAIDAASGDEAEDLFDEETDIPADEITE